MLYSHSLSSLSDFFVNEQRKWLENTTILCVGSFIPDIGYTMKRGEILTDVNFRSTALQATLEIFLHKNLHIAN